LVGCNHLSAWRWPSLLGDCSFFPVCISPLLVVPHQNCRFVLLFCRSEDRKGALVFHNAIRGIASNAVNWVVLPPCL